MSSSIRSHAVRKARFKESLFVSSTVGRFSDSKAVFVQGPLVKHLALSKECFSSSPLKSVFISVPWVSGKMEARCRGTSQEVLLCPVFRFFPPPLPLLPSSLVTITLCCNLLFHFVKSPPFFANLRNNSPRLSLFSAEAKVRGLSKVSESNPTFQQAAGQTLQIWSSDTKKGGERETGTGSRLLFIEDN